MKTMGSLFSGIGGWEFASRGKLKPLWAVEFAPEVALEYTRNHGHAPIVDDIYLVDEKLLAPVDVLVASPPCPGFSHARERTGVVKDADTLAGLEIIRFVRQLVPQYVAIENAPKFLKSDVAEEIIASLRDLYPYVEAAVWDAADYGTPQHRRRTIIRASHEKLSRPPLQEAVSWWDAVQDLDLPAAKLAPWQVRDMAVTPPAPGDYPVLVSGYGPVGDWHDRDARVWVGRSERAMVIARGKAVGGTKIVLRPGAVLGLNLEAFVRLSGMPPDIKLPGRSQALDILGNTIPPQLAAAALYDVLR